MFSRIRTPLYKNTGSVARDHLASERTFLAWMRTGLGFIALGVAIERFSQLDLNEILQQTLKPSITNSASDTEKKETKQQSGLLVGALLGMGSGSIAYGTSRYFVNLRLLEQGLFKPAFHGPAVLSVAVAGLAGGVWFSTVKNKTQDAGCKA